MDVRDLNILDWVLWDNTPCQVTAIGCDYIETTRCGITLAESHLLNPIPLTPEILEKNGFVANKHVYLYPYYEYINKEDKLKIGFAFPQGNRTSYKEPWVYIDSERVFVEHLPCIYVHELQHALRLCGVDKEITV